MMTMSPSRSVTLYNLSPASRSGLLIDLYGVDENSARGEGLQVLEAEPGHVVLVDVLPHRGLVEVAVLAPDMAQAVKVRADVALAEPRILQVGQLVLSERSAGGEGGGGQDRLAEPRAEERHPVGQRIRHGDDLAFLDLRRR